MTVPYIIEGTGSGERVYDLYSRLLKDRIVFIGKEFTSDLANSVCAQLLFLEADSPDKDIIMYINSPGGELSTAMAIYDTMNYIKPDVSTICIGQACSAGAFILAAGTKSKRYSLKNSRIMLHQSSTGLGGKMPDLEVSMLESRRVNDIWITEISNITGKTVKTIRKDLARDLWLSPEEAVEYGVIDFIMTRRIDNESSLR